MTRRDTRLLGVIPAAGLGSRLAPLAYPKELLPIVYSGGPAESGMRPTPVMSYSLELMRQAGVAQVCVVISDHKFEIARVFGGESRGMPLCYVLQNTPRGLADALVAALPWAAGCNVCFALPDTVVTPANALKESRALLQSTRADLVLGVFPTDVPEQLGPVRLGNKDSIVNVYEKPKRTDLRNTWAHAVWRPSFSKFLADMNANYSGGQVGPVLGEVFQAAVEAGLDVRAKHFYSGRFFDLGTPKGLETFVRWSMRGNDRGALPHRNGGASAAEADHAFATK